MHTITINLTINWTDPRKPEAPLPPDTVLTAIEGVIREHLQPLSNSATWNIEQDTIEHTHPD